MTDDEQYEAVKAAILKHCEAESKDLEKSVWKAMEAVQGELNQDATTPYLVRNAILWAIQEDFEPVWGVQGACMEIAEIMTRPGVTGLESTISSPVVQTIDVTKVVEVFGDELIELRAEYDELKAKVDSEEESDAYVVRDIIDLAVLVEKVQYLYDLLVYPGKFQKPAEETREVSKGYLNLASYLADLEAEVME